MVKAHRKLGIGWNFFSLIRASMKKIYSEHHNSTDTEIAKIKS